MSGSFAQGVGQWIGSAEVYDAIGNFAGHGRDQRTVVADDEAGTVTVDVTFDGPFSIGGRYTIVDSGTHRRYEGPVNYGYAEALGDGLIAANNYWPDLGLSQRFFLMVLPGGQRQLSLALINRGERAEWAVVGEYLRQTDADQPEPPAHDPIDVASVAGHPQAGRSHALVHRPGVWSGTLTLLDGDLQPTGETACREECTPVDDGAHRISIAGAGFGTETTFDLHDDGWSVWTPPGDVVGSASLFGGRALSGRFLQRDDQLQVWRREVVSLDGTLKAVVNTWYLGDRRVGLAVGTMAFEST